MKHILIENEKNGGDQFCHEFESIPAAISMGDDHWVHLTEGEKKNQIFYLLDSVNPDEDAIDHFDGDIVKEWSYYHDHPDWPELTNEQLGETPW